MGFYFLINIMFCEKSLIFVFLAIQYKLKPRLHLPRSSYDFSVCDLLYDFRHRRRSWATTYGLTIHTGIVRFFLICHLSTFSYKNARRSYGGRMSPQIVRRYRMDPVRCPYGVPIRFDTKRKEAAR